MDWTSLLFSKAYPGSCCQWPLSSDLSVLNISKQKQHRQINNTQDICGYSLISTSCGLFLVCRPLAQEEFFTKPKFSHLIEPSDCLSTPCDVMYLDMYKLQVKDLEVLHRFVQKKFVPTHTRWSWQLV